MDTPSSAFRQDLDSNRRGQNKGIYSVCSAHPLVIEAALRRGKVDGGLVLIESTSNQVDQYGGYTGMRPAEFAAWVYGIADTVGIDREKVLLGGDHLGPNAWRSLTEREAMDRAKILVRDYVAAGYRKIHLDCSMALADDVSEKGMPLSDEIVARRAAELCLVAERTAQPASEIRYVIGTEVPIPGGAREHEESLTCTSVEAARKTIEVTRGVFEAHGLHDAWKRVSALVVQPGVEFGDDFVIPYRSEAAKGLTDFIENVDGMVYEAHSTDYQTVENLRALVKGHFAILKVGPWLTYALREALFSLADLEGELARLGKCGTPSGLRQVVAEAMERDPQYWKAYYADDVAFKQFYSYSDRIRYYWNHPEVEAAVRRLMTNLDMPLSISLVSQFFPDALSAIRSGSLEPSPKELALFRIDNVLGFYAEACGQSSARHSKNAR